MIIPQPSHLNTRPFANRTTFDHLNTGLIRYSDCYCTCVWSSKGLDFESRQNPVNYQVVTQLLPCPLLPSLIRSLWTDPLIFSSQLKVVKMQSGSIDVTSFSSISYYSNVRLISKIILHLIRSTWIKYI